jgi:subtilisin family serine protease
MARRPELLDPVAESEIRVIERAFQEAGIYVEIEPDLAGQGLDFMYQKGVLLVRQEYLGQVIEIASPTDRDWAPEVQSVVRGVSLLSLAGSRFAEYDDDDGQHEDGRGDDGRGDDQDQEPGRDGEPRRLTSVLAALTAIDRRLPPSAATPNHVLTVCPVVPCMATEPEEVPRHAEPEPPPRHRRRHGERVRVYLADTGLVDGATSHRWLNGVQGDLDDRVHQHNVLPYAGHGTFGAGVARCVSPGIELYCANVFNIAGSALEADAVIKLTDALNDGYDIINLSASTSTRLDLPPLTFEAWLADLAQHPDVACVAPAGNNDSSQLFYPASMEGIIAVGALDRHWRYRADFSNYGKWVDLYAPGTGLVNAWAHGRYECYLPDDAGEVRHFHGMARCSGTSFAAPIVTGRIANRMSATGETATEAAAALLTGAYVRPGVGRILLP